MSYSKLYKLEVQLKELNLTTGTDHTIRSFTAELGQSKPSAIALFHSIYEHSSITDKGESENDQPGT